MEDWKNSSEQAGIGGESSGGEVGLGTSVCNRGKNWEKTPSREGGGAPKESRTRIEKDSKRGPTTFYVLPSVRSQEGRVEGGGGGSLRGGWQVGYPRSF